MTLYRSWRRCYLGLKSTFLIHFRSFTQFKLNLRCQVINIRPEWSCGVFYFSHPPHFNPTLWKVQLDIEPCRTRKLTCLWCFKWLMLPYKALNGLGFCSLSQCFSLKHFPIPSIPHILGCCRWLPWGRPKNLSLATWPSLRLPHGFGICSHLRYE